MTKITLSHLTNLQNEATAVNTLNANTDTVVSSFDNTLSRDGTAPNQMMANLDMNSNQIYNLPAPASATSPARLQDVTTSTIISSVPPVGTSGAVVGLLNGNNTVSGNNTFSGNNIYTGTQNFQNATPLSVGVPSGNNGNIVFNTTTGIKTLSASAGTGQTFTLPNTTDTLIGKATVDILTNKTLDTAGAGNVFKINGTSIAAVTGSGSAVLSTSPTLATPAIIGNVAGTSPAGGNVGEHVSSFILPGSAITVPVANSGVAFNLTSMSLTAGDWDLQAIVYISPLSGACVFDNMLISISAISGTHNTIVGYFSGVQGLAGTAFNAAVTFPSANGANFAVSTIPSTRIGIAGTITYYLVVTPIFTAGVSLNVYGGFRGRRFS